jgi:hypothetical protein
MNLPDFLLNSPVEVRFLGRERWALYTAEPASIREALADPHVQGLDAYVTLNELKSDTPVQRDVLFRARKNQLTKDEDIARRRFILFDSDSIKPTGAAATAAQRNAAHAHSAAVEAALTAEGWPRPIVCDSGNGSHRLYALDLPNDRETALLISSLLKVAARKLDTADVIVDQTVWNASRITRLYGSRNHKAGRDSAVIFVPDMLTVVTPELLKSTVEKWRGSLGYKKPLVARLGDWTPERMEAFLDFHGIPYSHPVEKNGGLLWVLDFCPFNEDHTGSSVAILITKSGFPKFKCLHNGCAGITNAPWRKFVGLLNVRNRKVFSWEPQRKYGSKSLAF